MRYLFFKSLRTRIIALVLFALLPALLMILYTASEERRLTIMEIKKSALMTGQLVASEDEQFIEGARQLLLTLAQFIGVHDSSFNECHIFLVQLLKKFPRYENLGIAKFTGEVLCSAVPIQAARSLTESEWFKQVLETHELTIGNYHVGKDKRRMMLVLGNPLISADGTVKGVVFVMVDPKWINQFNLRASIPLPRDSTLKLVDINGVVLMCQPDPDKMIGSSLKATALLKVIMSQRAGIVQSLRSDGTPCLNAVAPVPGRFRNRQIYVVFEIPKKIAFADSNRIMLHNLILLGIVAGFTIAMAWIGGQLFIMRQVKALVTSSKKIAAGDLKARTGLAHENDEFGLLAETFDDMASLLEQREQERSEAEKKIKRSREQLRNLSSHLQTVREEERIRIAREIHDDLGQALTALKMDLFWLMKKMPEAQELVLRKIESMSAIIDATIETVHRISTELRPGILDDIGLPAAIEWQVDEFQERINISAEIVANLDDEVNLNREQSTAIFRIFQEILTNVMRHAHATKVTVALEEKEGKIILMVEDNGRGISKKEISDTRAYGIIGMKERVRPWDGEVEIVGVPGKGTTVTVSIPKDKVENYS